MGVIGLSWLLLAGVYLAFAGSVSAAEAGAAVLCGGLGALWVRALIRCGDRDVRLRPRALRPLLPALAGLAPATLKVGARLVRAALRGDVAGGDRAVPHAAVPGCPPRSDDPHAAGACALAVLAASLSPSRYVLRLEPERGRVLLHDILPAPGGGAR